MFRVGVTRDIHREDGSPIHDLALLDAAPEIEWEFLRDGDEIEDADGYDALIVFSPKVTRATVAEAGHLVLIARLGVGYDRVDVDACTEHGVLLTITPDGVRAPMASGAMAFVLALAHRLIEKDRSVREGVWERFAHVGSGLEGRILGVVGLGNLGHAIARLATPFGLRVLAADPYVDAADGAELVDLETLLREADFVVVVCPLTDETRHLLDAERLALMKRSAFLINIARGPIVDQVALAEALRAGRLAGAALDVFEEEPLAPDDPLLSLDNLLLAPHAIGLTEEIFRGCGQSASRAVLDVAAGRVPRYLVNAEALEHPRVAGRLQ
jgi:phosphoglycerate dehydrogenase-like enzyme